MAIQRTFRLLGMVFFILGLCCPAYGEKDLRFSLRLESLGRGGALFEYPVHSGEEFTLYYIHSSDHTPVRDTFRIDHEGRLLLIEEAFLWYGAGLEFLNHQESRITYEGEWTKVRLNRVFPELVLRVGRVARQRLIFKDRTIFLDALAPPGESIVLSIVR